MDNVVLLFGWANTDFVVLIVYFNSQHRLLWTGRVDKWFGIKTQKLLALVLHVLVP